MSKSRPRPGQSIGTWIKEVRAGLAADEGRAMSLFVALGALVVTATIGAAYARDIAVQGWQLWSWLVSVIIALVALLSAAGRPPLDLNRRWLWLPLLLLIALLLRLLFLETVPGGLHVDEHGVADFSLRHVFALGDQTVNPFRTSTASQPSLYNYLVRLSLAVAGHNITGLRLWSVLAGTAGVLATFILVDTFQDRRTAVFAAVIMTAYHYHVHWSRIGLNNIWDTLWVPMMLAPFAWGWRKKWDGGAVLSGAAVGFSQYFYAGSRLGLILLAALIWRTWLRTADRRKLAGYAGTMMLMAAIIAAPILFMALLDPGPFFERTRVVLGWKPELMIRVTGDPPDFWAYFRYQLGRSAGAFIAVPDVTGFYAPRVPFIIGLGAPLFVIGLIWAAFKERWLPILWIALTIWLAGFALSDPPGSSHYVVSIPAICWLVALPLGWLWSRGNGRLALALLFLVVAVDLYFYFGIYVPGEPYDLIHPFPVVQ